MELLIKNLIPFSGLVKLKVADAIQLNCNIIIRDEINFLRIYKTEGKPWDNNHKQRTYNNGTFR